jgi:hypothetical protein
MPWRPVALDAAHGGLEALRLISDPRIGSAEPAAPSRASPTGRRALNEVRHGAGTVEGRRETPRDGGETWEVDFPLTCTRHPR